MNNLNKFSKPSPAIGWARKAKWLAAAAMALLLSPAAQAQISGTKTVCSTGCDYSSISAAITALKANGINGKTTIQIKKGTYNESVSINGGKSGIAGVSATNTLTFIGMGTVPTDVYIYNTNTYVVNLSNISYVTLENLHIDQTTASDFYQALNVNSVSKCTVKNCRLTTVASSTLYEDLNPLYIMYSTDNLFESNTFRGGYDAINEGGYTSGNARNVYKNNVITNFSYDGINAQYSDANQYIGNYLDSGTYTYASAINSVYETNAKYWNNTMILKSMYYGVFLQPVGYMEYINNMMLGSSGCYEMLYIQPLSSGFVMKIQHNTIHNPNSGGECVYYDNANKATIDFENNILTSAARTLNMLAGKGGINLNDIIEGNNYYSTGSGTLITYAGTSYSTFAAYQSAAAVNGHGKTDMNMAVKYKSATDLHVDQSSLTPYAKNIGINTDIDGDSRCKTIVTSGADESYYSGNPHFGKPSKPSFTGPSTAYDGSPAIFLNGATAGNTIMYSWYVNNVKVSDSFHLETTALTGPSSKVKLVAQTCGGKDSAETTVTVTLPPNAPTSDFVSSSNFIMQGDIVKFTDISGDYPSKWLYKITPDSIYDNGIKVNSYDIVNGNLTSPSPTLRFNYPGKYKVCLTASNKKGTGNTECKTDYITVAPAIFMTSGTQEIRDTTGYIFDNGGIKNPHTSNVTSSILLTPCAQEIYLQIKKFDLECGYDYLRVFDGVDNTGIPLHCKGNASGSNGPGFTGGVTAGCASASTTCIPNPTDTFVAKSGKMYIEFTSDPYVNGAGFEAFYWTKPKTQPKPTASFTSPDSICVNGLLSFTNTSTGSDITYFWDLDGDLSAFEPAAKSGNASWPYFTDGQVTVTLIAQNCGGADTFQKTITVFNPASPSTSFVADNTNPTTNDIVFLSTDMKECVDAYKWTITSASGKGIATFVDGTKNSSANPHVMFSDTGCYSVELYTANSTGDDNLKLNCFIKVKNPYCVPSIMNQGADLGISKVVFNTINNSSPQGSATGYTNYALDQTKSTTIEIAATYSLTVERNTNANRATRTVYIDWNGDGDFVDAGEKVAEEQNKTTLSWTTDITVPTTAKLGATVMRIVINQGSQTNTPCGPNKFGEFEDYRVYIRPYLTLPVIELTGNDTVTMEQGNPYVEPGYTATSKLYGVITSDVKVTDPGTGFYMVPGTYKFRYNVTDASGNIAKTVIRVVVITPDVTAPALIVTKPDSILLQVGSSFTPPAVISANDLVDGDLSGAVKTVNGVNPNVIGDYTVTYSVTDVSKNTATVVRYVKVIDTVMPTITLVGSSATTHKVGTTYTDSGVVVKDNYYSETVLRSNLTVDNKVDENTVGVYTVTYILKDPYTGKTVSVTRTVEVKDAEKPVVTLVGDSTITLDVFATFIDQGVKITDNYDKNLQATTSGSFYQNFPNGKATKTGTYTVIYTVTDASGNTTTINRTIVVVDREAPVISLIGDPAASVCRWGTYTDAGQTATDNYDATSELTITQEGNFLTSGTDVEGVYTLRYKAVDKSGNVSYSKWRYIYVRNPYEFPCTTLTSVGEQIGLDKLVNVYPNPNQGKFTVEANIAATEQVRITVTNLLGQEIAVISNGALSTHTFSVDLSNQKAGVYMLNVTTDKQTVTKRIVVTK